MTHLDSSLSLYEQVGNRQEELVLAHMAMVKRVAIHLKARIPPYMELEELVQVGIIGLIEASRGYDPSKGIAFENFALSRVRGAILDEVRRQSVLSRSSVAFKRTEAEAVRALSGELGRAPTQSEIAIYLGQSTEEFHKNRDAASNAATSMEQLGDEVMNIAGDRSLQPEAILEHAQDVDQLALAMDQLDDRHKLVISLYYVEEMNLKEIGAVLGVSESRVSQILSTTVKKLRAQFNMNG